MSKATNSPSLCLNNSGNFAVTQNGALIYQQNFILERKRLNQDSGPLPRLHLPRQFHVDCRALGLDAVTCRRRTEDK